MTLDEWRRQGATFDYRGNRIAYHVQGSGPNLVCIHGFPTAAWDWVRLWPELTKRFRVVAPDMIGFGFSAKPRAYDYSIHDQATLHEELLARLGSTETHVLAHDYGDSVAQELLARHEERVRQDAPGLRLLSVCFLNGGLFPERHRPRPIQKLLLGPLGAIVSRLLSESAFRRSFAAVFGPHTKPTDTELGELWQLITWNGGHRISHRLIRYMLDRRKHRDRWMAALQATSVPLRLIDGPEDPVSGRHLAEYYRQQVPNADVVLLEGIGHYPQVEDPAGVLDAFLELTARVGGVPTPAVG